MMQLLSAWKESLLLFKPSNFKLFFLVTLKSCIDTLQVWFRYWWWLIGVVVVGPYLISNVLDCVFPFDGRWFVWYEPLFFITIGPSAILINQFVFNVVSEFSCDKLFFTVYYPCLIILTCLLALLYISLYLSARPSVAIKNWHYFKNYKKHIFYAIVWVLFLASVNDACYWVLDHLPVALLNILSSIPEIFIAEIVGVFELSISLFYIIFLLDSDGSFKQVLFSIKRALKMVIYNLPFCIGMLIFNAILETFLLFDFVSGIKLVMQNIIADKSLLDLVMISIKNSINIFIALFLACFFVNYYIKKTHENYSLYFGK